MSAEERSIRLLSFEEFHDAAEAWDDLVQAGALPLPFLSHEWIRVWWRHFGGGQHFVAPVVQQGQRFLAGVPLTIRGVRHLGFPLRLAEIVGTGPVPTRGMGLADKADVLVRSDAPEAGTALCRGLFSRLDGVDVLDLKGLDESSPSLEPLCEGAPDDRAVLRMQRSSSPYLRLSCSWDEYLASRSGNFRKHLRKYRRELGKLGEIEIARMGTADEADAWLAEAVEVNEASWKADRGTNLFRHPRIRAFVLDVGREMAHRDRLDLHVLRVDGAAVAYELCFDLAGRVSSYNGSYRKELGRQSPGTLLTASVIETACERGRVEYDLLRGDEAYKARWSDEVRREVQLVLPSSSRRARSYVHWAIEMKARLKRSPRLRELGDRVAGFMARMRHAGGSAGGAGRR